MRSEEEIRAVLGVFWRTAENPTSVRESEWCGVAIGILLWVLGLDPGDVRRDLELDKFGGR